MCTVLLFALCSSTMILGAERQTSLNWHTHRLLTALEKHRESYDSFAEKYNAWIMLLNKESQVLRVSETDKAAATVQSLKLKNAARQELIRAKKQMEEAVDAMKDLEKEMK